MARTADEQQQQAALRAVTRPGGKGVRRRSANFTPPVEASLLEPPELDEDIVAEDTTREMVDALAREKGTFAGAQLVHRGGQPFYRLPALTPVVTSSASQSGASFDDDDDEPDPEPATPFEAGEVSSPELDPPASTPAKSSVSVVPSSGDDAEDDAEGGEVDPVDSGEFDEEVHEESSPDDREFAGVTPRIDRDLFSNVAASREAVRTAFGRDMMPRGSMVEMRRGNREPMELDSESFPDGVSTEPSPALTVPSGTIRNLRAWMSRFRFTQDYDFIRFSRMTPAVYAGQNAKGWLFDAYEVTDESYIANFWGGDTLLVEAFQDGRHHPVDSGLLMLGGHPKAYRGGNGEPVPFPSNAANSSLPGVPRNPAGSTLPPLPGLNYPPNMAGSIMPREELAGASGPFSPIPVNQQHVPFGGVPVSDLINLADRVAQTTAGRNDAAALQKANAESIEAVRDMAAAQMANQQQQMEALLRMKDEQTKPLAATVEVYRSQMESAERNHRAVTDRMSQDHKAALDHALADHRAQVESIQRSHESTLSSQRQSYESMLLAVREDSRRQEATVRDQWRMESESLNREIQRLRDDSGKSESRLRESFEKQLSDIRAAYEKQLSDLRADASARETRVAESTKMAYDGQLTALRQQLDAANVLVATRVEDVRNMASNTQRSIEDNYKLQLQHRDSEIQRLRDDVARLGSELAESRTALSQRSNPLTAVREVAEMTQTFQHLTGNGPAPQAAPEPEPTTLMGQLAKYGPIIGQHVIAPVMKPVQDAVKVAQEDSVRRAEVQREMLLMRQHQNAMAQQQHQQQMGAGAAQLRQAGPPVRSQTVVRANVPPPVVPREVVSPSRVIPVAQEPEETSTQGSQEEMEANLSQWLEKELSSNTSPADVAAQIKMGVQAGMVPSEVVDSMTAQEPAEVIKFIQDAARKNNARVLVTPRGTEFIREILKSLK